MEEPLAVSESLNALANGHDKVSPFPKRRRKSGGNDADADAQPQGDALDGSGRSRPEANKGVLETRGRDGTPLKGAGPEGDEGTTGGAEGSEQAAAAADTAGKSDGKKIARARSAWMLFLADNREKHTTVLLEDPYYGDGGVWGVFLLQVREGNPGLPIGPMQKILSEMWKGLSEEETARYTKLAAEDKERMKKELAAAGLSRLPAKDSGSASTVPGGPTSLVLPLARVRKTVRLDPGVGNISKEGLLLVTKATEVFMAMMADKSWKIGRQTGRKSVRPCDVADFVFAAPEMYWLRGEFREERSSVKKKNKPEPGKMAATVAAKAVVPKGATPITSFFQKKA
eukprot:jgi/Undpi1/4692/HiC_scaffold_18.g08045.m1